MTDYHVLSCVCTSSVVRVADDIGLLYLRQDCAANTAASGRGVVNG